jgi:hypothetical protein
MKQKYLRIVVPIVLIAVFAVIVVFVFNAFEATHLMATEKRAGPTLLNR